MTTKKVKRSAALLLALGLAATACGSSKKASTGGANSTTATTTASSAAPTSGASTTNGQSGGGGSAAGAVIPAKGSGQYGQDASNPKLYKGAGDFQIDTTKCPSDWNDKQGITDSEIDLFTSIPKAGPFAGFGLLGDGMTNYFNYVNDNGGIDGRKIKLDVKDDGYQPQQTKTNVDEALGGKKYAAMPMILGTANNLAVWDELNKECMPELFAATGAAQWGDVENHPWTTGMQLDYFTEAKIWAEWLKKQYPQGAKVAAIVYNNDFGKSYAAGFKDAIKGTNIQLVKEATHTATDPNLNNQYTTLAATNADVLLLETSGAFCTQGMAAVEKGAWKPKVIMSGTCGSLGQFFKPLIDQGLTGKDTYLVQNYIDVTDPANANLDIVKAYQQQAKKEGLDPTKTTYATGWIFGWYMTEVLKEAASYKGGLTRANIMLAARAIQQTNPMLIKGLTSKMDGMKDAYLTEGGQMVQYQVTDPKQFGKFVPSGDLINLEGKLGTYATVQKALAAQG